MSNITLITEMAEALKPLLHKVVFVGGCVVELLVDDKASANIRITKDVDIVAEISTRGAYYSLLNELKTLGFKHNMPIDEPSPICRLIYKGMLLDVMPTDESVLGFSNRWYLPALENTRAVELGNGLSINMIASVYFIATKLVAFRSRGQSDLYCHDMEDIITVYNGNTNIVAEIQNADADVKRFIKDEFETLLTGKSFRINCIAGHLGRTESPGRIEVVYRRIVDSIS